MTRFEDTLRRDLQVIADRATPSSDAWEAIHTRIAEPARVQDTEIIMLTDNTMPTRRWPLVAAAAAVIALTIGAIVSFGTGGDDEQIPSDPVPTVQSPPDDDGDDLVTPDDVEEVPEQGAPDAEPDAVDADVSVTDSTAPRSFSLSGRLSGVLEFAPPDEDGVGTFSGDDVLTGDMVGVGAVNGTYVTNAAEDGLDGRHELLASVDIDGIGSGTLVIEEQWASKYSGAAENTGVVTAGTGSFLGATGTFAYSAPDGTDNPDTEAVETFGDYTLELTLPPTGAVDASSIRTADGRLIRSGGQTGANEFVEFDDGTERRTYTYTSTLTDPKTGLTNTGFGHELLVGDEPAFGIGVHGGPATIEGIGSGTVEWLSYWTTGPVIDNRSFLIGATGDMAGYTGFGRSFSTDQGREWDGFSEFTPGTSYTSVTASGTWNDSGYTETPRPDSTTVDVASTTDFDGDVVGTGVGTGIRTPDEDGSWGSGADTVEFTGEIAGIGSGTLTIEERFSTAEEFFSVGVITDGTGDFAGARGTVSFSGAGSYEFDIEVPDTAVEQPRVVELSATFADTGDVESESDDGSWFVTGLTRFTGDLVGVAPHAGTRSPDGSLMVGSGDFGFSGTIDGVGTGTLTMRDVWRHDESGRWVGAMVITGGTGDFAGAGGWMLNQSSEFGTVGSTEISLHLPAGN